MKFNENLKYLRKQAGLTQEQLAEKLSVSRQAITKWESGESLPDVENLKEISYIFSISIDSLLGDIESKSTSKLNKKINDIGWFIFVIVILLARSIFSLGKFIDQVFNGNENIIIPSYILMAILAFIIFFSAIKRYLKNKKDLILDMTPTKKGKSIRIKHIIKTNLLFFCFLVAFDIIFNLYLLPQGIEEFTTVVFPYIIFSIVFVSLIGICDYILLENKVKDLNDIVKDDKESIIKNTLKRSLILSVLVFILSLVRTLFFVHDLNLVEAALESLLVSLLFAVIFGILEYNSLKKKSK